MLERKLFRCIVPDNGTEFSDPEMAENCRPDPEHNPYKLLPRGVRVFYCDPYCSCQKPHIERFHKLGIVRIPQDRATLHPFLLGRKFQKAADKAVLKKNGLFESKKTEK